MSVANTRVAVVGGGIMGAGIAFVARAAGFPVTIVEADSDASSRPAPAAPTSPSWGHSPSPPTSRPP